MNSNSYTQGEVVDLLMTIHRRCMMGDSCYDCELFNHKSGNCVMLEIVGDIPWHFKEGGDAVPVR